MFRDMFTVRRYARLDFLLQSSDTTKTFSYELWLNNALGSLVEVVNQSQKVLRKTTNVIKETLLHN